MDVSLLGNKNTNGDFPTLQPSSKPTTNTAELFKVKSSRTAWKTVKLSNEDLEKYAEGDLSISSLHLEPMQHRFLYFRFKKNSNAAIKLTKTFLSNLDINIKYVSWLEHTRIDNAPDLGMIVRNRIAKEVVTKVSKYLVFRSDLRPEQILNNIPVEDMVPKPQKDLLKRVLVTVEKLKLLNFRPQFRKFLEKLHSLATDVPKETSKDQQREQVSGPATTQVVPLVPDTSVAVPTNATSSVTKKQATAA